MQSRNEEWGKELKKLVRDFGVDDVFGAAFFKIKIEPFITQERRCSVDWSSYVEACEYQEGFCYWLAFDNAQQVIDDFELYMANQ